MLTQTLCCTPHIPQTQPAPGHALCPVCSGFLVPAGGQLQCSRCRFLFCEGCEGSNSEPWTDAAEGGR